MSAILKPIAWARRWHADGEIPKKERNKNGRLAWPLKFKLLAVTPNKILPNDVPLVEADRIAELEREIAGLRQQLAASADKTAATVQPANYTVEGVVMTALEYIDYLHDKLSAAPQPQAAQDENELHFNAQRLRNVAKLVGLETAVPEDDATLDGARAAVLGMIAYELRQAAKAAPRQVSDAEIIALGEKYEIQPFLDLQFRKGNGDSLTVPEQKEFDAQMNIARALLTGSAGTPTADNAVSVASVKTWKQRAKELWPSADIAQLTDWMCLECAFDEILELRVALAASSVIGSAGTQAESAGETCTWTMTDDENGIWESACGSTWIFIDGGPTENKMSFCHCCGKPMREVSAGAGTQEGGANNED